MFPGEEPSDEEILRDWLKINLPVLRRGYGSAIRNVTPAHLVKYESGPDDLSDYTRIVHGTTAATGMSSAQCQEYNRRVAIAEAARDERARNGTSRAADRSTWTGWRRS